MIFTAPYSIVSAGSLAPHFHPNHLADLRASGLKDETIRAAGVYSLAPRFLEKFFREVPAEIESALCFAYQSGAFARIKLFPPLGKMKYCQPPKTTARLYIPTPISDDQLYVCEGEKKTLSAIQSGLNSIGIGGLWTWRSNGQPICDLKLVGWDGRDVTIIPDSDVFGRFDLLRPIYALGRELRASGASVLVAQIPQDGAVKVGLDDYLLAGGNVSGLEVFSLGHRIFKNCAYWHGRWKLKAALAA